MASRSRPPPPPPPGRTTGSTSSIRPATSTSRLRSSARCASSTARSRCSTRSPASSLSPRPSGARPTSTRFRGSPTSTRWTASARTSTRASQTMIDRLGAHPVPIQLPIGAEGGFLGIIDLVEMQAITYQDDLGKDVIVGAIPDEYADAAETAREHLLEEVSHYDDELLELLLEEAEVPVATLKRAIRAATLEIKLTPGLCGSSFKNKGVQPLLDAVIDYLPEPARRPADGGARPPARRRRGRARGPRAIRRSTVQRARVQDRRRPVRRQARLLPRLLRNARARRQGPQRHDRPHRADGAHPDDARQRPRGGRARLRGRHRGRRRHQADRHRRHALLARRIRSGSRTSPSPSRSSRSPSSRRRSPTRRRCRSRSGRLAEEDPTFRVQTNEETGQTEISGMGELHLEILVDRMKREFNVEANVGRPQVSYRETIKGTATKIEGRFVTPDRRLGPVRHRLHRHGAGARRGLRLRQQDQGRLGPVRVHPRRREGLRGVHGDRRQGRLPDGRRPRDADRRQVPRHRLVGDRVQGRRLAGASRRRQSAPSRCCWSRSSRSRSSPRRTILGDVIGDLSRRRGRVEGQDQRGNALAVTARVPLSEMFGYATDVRSMTQGRATYTMQFDTYEEVPPNIAEKIVEERRRASRRLRSGDSLPSPGCPRD